MAEKLSSAAKTSTKSLKRHLGTVPSHENDTASVTKAKKTNGHWALGLQSALNDKSLHIDSDDQMVVIKDAFPKARHHLLVLPKKNIPDLKSLTKDDLNLMRHLEKVGWNLAEKYGVRQQFRLGYHAIPSMRHLHMHVISQDFDSPCLKTKKHWNSFNSPYFIDSSDIIKQLEDSGRLTMDTTKNEELLKLPLRCHICSMETKTIPALKTHIKVHDL